MMKLKSFLAAAAALALDDRFPARLATLLSAEAGPANVTTGATRAARVVATMVWHAPSGPRPDCFRDARMDEVLASWFG